MMQVNVDFLERFIRESELIAGIERSTENIRQEIIERRSDGYVGALLLLQSEIDWIINRYIDEDLICDVYNRIFDSTHSALSLKRYQALGDLLRFATWSQQNARFHGIDQRLQHIAEFHFRFGGLDRFFPDNGRTNRALAYFLMTQACLEPFVFTAHDSQKLYLPCFGHTDTQMMRDYFMLKWTTRHTGHVVM